MTELQSHTALLRAPRQLDIVARPKPKAELNEILVRTAATAVCHTDLEIYTGNHPGTPVQEGMSTYAEMQGFSVVKLKAR